MKKKTIKSAVLCTAVMSTVTMTPYLSSEILANDTANEAMKDTVETPVKDVTEPQDEKLIVLPDQEKKEDVMEKESSEVIKEEKQKNLAKDFVKESSINKESDKILSSKKKTTLSAEYGGLELSDWLYSTNSSGTTVTLSHYQGDSVQVKIPGEIDGKEVKFAGFEQLFSLNKYHSTIVSVETIAVNGKVPYCVGTLSRGFRLMGNLEYVDLSNMDCVDFYSKGQSLDEMFYRCENLKEVNLTGFRIGEYTTADKLFNGCSKLETIHGLETWDVSNIKNFNYMFGECRSLKSIDISMWNIENCEHAQFMFSDCTKLENVQLPDFSNATKFTSTAYMFFGCPSLQSIDLSSFTAPNLRNVQDMFYGCTTLKEIDLSPLKTDNLRILTSIFEKCTALEKVIMPEIPSSVFHANRMFFNCKSLHYLDLSKFDASGIDDINFKNNFWVDGTLDDRHLLVVANDEKLLNYDYKGDNRSGGGPMMNTNNGLFADGSTLHKIEDIFVLPDLSTTTIQQAIRTAVDNHEIPTRENHTFLRWDKAPSTKNTIPNETIEKAYQQLNNVTFLAKWSTSTVVINNAPVINAVDRIVEYETQFDPLEGVTAYDDEDGEIIMTMDNIIRNDVSMKKSGVYHITYKVSDSQGASTEKTITITVKDKDNIQPITPVQPDQDVINEMPNTGDITSIGVVGSVFISSAGLLAAGLKKKGKQ